MLFLWPFSVVLFKNTGAVLRELFWQKYGLMTLRKIPWASLVTLTVKNPPATRETWVGRSPGGGHGNPLQYSCLGNPHEQRSLAGCRSWHCKESNTTERLSTKHHGPCPQWAYNVQVSPTFWEFALHHFTFIKDLHSYLFLLTKRNLRKIFTLRKREESKNRVEHVFHSWLLTEAVHTQAVRALPPSSFPESCTQPLSIRPLYPCTTSVSICALCLSCAFVCKMCPLVILLWFMLFAYIHRNLYFQTEGKPIVGKEEKRGIKIPPLVEGSMWFCDHRNTIIHLSTCVYIYMSVCVYAHATVF